MRAVKSNDNERMKEETVKKIMQEKNKGDYYSVLGLPTDCSVEDVRRAFLKLSLLVHPDKNKSPDATEAFEHVLDACERLKKLKLSDTDEADTDDDEEEPVSYSDEEEEPDDEEESASHSDDDTTDEEEPAYHSGNGPSINGYRQETPEGWGQYCVLCGGAKDGIFVRRPYCSWDCVQKFLEK